MRAGRTLGHAARVRLAPLALSLTLLAAPAFAQQGPHARDAERHASDPDLTWTWERALASAAAQAATTQPRLAYHVYGYLPYWETIDASFRWDLISDLVVFAAGLRSDGTISSWHGWPNTSLISTAHSYGVKVHLCATLFNSSAGTEITTFLSSATAQAQAIQALVSSVQAAGGDGLNLDFEFVPSAMRDAFSSFLEQTQAALVKAIPEAELSIASPPSVGYKGYDFARVAKVARLLLMGYDYHYAGAGYTGPVAPLTKGGFWSQSVSTDVDAVIALAPPGAVVLGVPYYGYDWASQTSAINSPTTAKGTAVLFKDAVVKSAADGRKWDAPSQTPWYEYQVTSVWHQTWYDDGESISDKYQYLKSRKLAGAMIWALGYDSGRTELWQAIESELGVPVTDGGPGDAGTTDAGAADAGATDAGQGDAGQGDAGQTDAGVPDAGTQPADDGGSDASVDPHPVAAHTGCTSAPATLPVALAIALLGLALRRRRQH
jgi:MYXO-CTERM domain-containing protein